jgi:hypothetical protein
MDNLLVGFHRLLGIRDLFLSSLNLGMEKL